MLIKAQQQNKEKYQNIEYFFLFVLFLLYKKANKGIITTKKVFLINFVTVATYSMFQDY